MVQCIQIFLFLNSVLLIARSCDVYILLKNVLINGFKLSILLKALPVTNLRSSVFCY